MKLITDFLKENAVKFANKPALSMKMGFRAVDFTYAEFYELAKKVAILLEQQGVGKNDKVVICAPNSPYWMAIFFGCNLIGAVPVPLNIQSTADIIRLVVDQTGAKVFFKYQGLKLDLSEELKFFDVEGLAEQLEGIDASAFVERTDISDEDLVQIMYTSGTTGAPKGVMLTHKNMVTNLEGVHRCITLSSGDRLLSILPLSHIYEQMAGFLMPFSFGAHIVYAHSHGAIRNLLKQYKITYMLAVPEFLHVMLSRVEAQAEAQGKGKLFQKMLSICGKLNIKWISRLVFRKVLSNLGGSLRAIASGGAALDPEIQKKWIAMGIDILPGYGLTETSPVVSTNTFDTFKLGTVGKVLDNVQVKLGEDKEILVKGPNVFKGYFKNEEKTKEAFTEDGWYKTGDLGEFDSEGFLSIKGRKKYMILSASGQNVYPEDIEFELNKIPGIADSAVLGIEKGHGAVDIFAVLLLEPEAKVNVERSIDEANLNLASYQHVTNWMVWPEVDFPRTATRKVKKEELRKVIEGNIGQDQKEDVSGKSRLKKILADITGTNVARITEKTTVGQLNLDSLMRVELVSAIEDVFAVSIQESEIKQSTTVGQIEEMITSNVGVKPVNNNLKHWPRSWWATILRSILQPIFFLISKIYIRVKIEGRENLEGLEYPVIFMANHLSYFDGALVVMALPTKVRKRLAFAAARDALYEEFKVIAPIVDLLFNTYPLQRGDDENIKLGLENTGKMLDKGYSVVLFPEGHISKDGKMQPIKKGAGLIAVEMGVPVLPIFIDKEIQQIFPFLATWPVKRGNVTVRIGKPIKFHYNQSYTDAAAEIEKVFKESE